MSCNGNTNEKKSTEKRDPSEQKPVIPDEYVKNIVLRLYGMTVTDWTELNSYDDRNYHIHVKANIDNEHITECHRTGYVLKVLNSVESKNPIIVEAQHEMLMHLYKHGIPIQEPIRNVHGQTWSVEKVPSDKNPERMYGPYVFQMLKYIEGDIVVRIPYYPKTLYNIGMFAGKIHKALKDFEHPFFKNRTFIWSLKEVEGLSEYKFAVENKDNLDLVTKVMKSFQEEVVPKYVQLNQGYIHGDMNEQNILVKQLSGDVTSACDVTAFIDFVDMTYSCIVFDIAILIAYMSLDCDVMDQLDVGGHILAGYLTEMNLNDAEMDVLRICICGRLIQSLVMGAYSYHMDPKNKYVLTTAKRGWPLLWKYWQTSKSDLQNTIGAKYTPYRTYAITYDVKKNMDWGYIHGDMNEQNILVKQLSGDVTSACDVTAFIDFVDMTYSCIVFDIAILIAYMSLDCDVMDQLDVGGHILAGYLTEMNLNDAEMDVLRICICGRLIQSLVMGAYSYHMDPKNKYVLTTAKRGWPLLWKYWQTSKSDLQSRWCDILQQYQNKS